MQKQRSQHQSIGYVAINILFFFFFSVEKYICTLLWRWSTFLLWDIVIKLLSIWNEGARKSSTPFQKRWWTYREERTHPQPLWRVGGVYDSHSWWSEEGEEPPVDHRVDTKLSFCASAASEWTSGTGCAAQSHRCGGETQPADLSRWRSGSKKEGKKAHIDTDGFWMRHHNTETPWQPKSGDVPEGNTPTDKLRLAELILITIVSL